MYETTAYASAVAKGPTRTCTPGLSARTRTSLGAPDWSPTIACSLYQATWGVIVTFSRPRNGCALGKGSGSVVSSAHPAIRPESSALTSACVLTMGPRAQLIKNAVGFIFARD